MKYLWIFLFLWCPLCFVTGYELKATEIQEDTIECKSPQNLGDKTIAKLVEKDGVLSLSCEYHSI